MLGLTISEQKWIWSASGKHPVARDFFRIGQDSAIGSSMSEWVNKGFSQLKADMKTGRSPRFWRFWARGGAKNELVCGILRDSCDSMGRFYPILVLGAGTVSSWEEHWDLLPFACEPTWKRIEYLCTRNQGDLAGFEREIINLRPPVPDWQNFSATSEAGINSLQEDHSARALEKTAGYAQDDQHMTVVLDCDFPDNLLIVSLLLRSVRENRKIAPNIVLIGGSLDSTLLSVYWRPLLSGDFAVLWG